MFRKSRFITANYLPTEWGVKVEGEKITAWAKLCRVGKPSDYNFYGDDADAYESFEADGFVISNEVAGYAEAEKWIKMNVLGE